ncbi:cold-shock protein [Algivirga pacifica]|uniref:Cold shock domain-containing protein n=1 Tax=Algivirga pacifica TaxID=1162670 RepID=A0ABP9DEV5_9BACT
MGRSKETFSKKEKEKKRQKKKELKEKKRMLRKEEGPGGSDLDSMMAYVDEFGNITSTPPDPEKIKEQRELDAQNIEISVSKSEDLEEDDTPNEGKVEFFNHGKGFGFIRDKDTKEKHFVHVSGLIDEIDEGDLVSFDLEEGLKGINAVNVKRIG